MAIRKSSINKNLQWILWLSFLLISVAPANTRPIFKWQVGEQLIYSVKWSFFTLGKLKLTVLKSDTLAGRKVYHCRINIDSNPSLPFVNIHDIYDSFMDAEDFSSNIFLSYEHEHGYLQPDIAVLLLSETTPSGYTSKHGKKAKPILCLIQLDRFQAEYTIVSPCCIIQEVWSRMMSTRRSPYLYITI